MDKPIRAFYAIDLSVSMQQTINRIIHKLQQQDWSEQVRWVAADNLHLTIRFLGNLTPEQITTINHYVHKVVPRLRPFTLRLGQIRLFPNRKNPRVIAIMVSADEHLKHLVELVESCALATGLTPEKREFKAHITIGRCRAAFPHRIKLITTDHAAEMPVNHITLYNSELTPDGPCYTALNEFLLR